MTFNPDLNKQAQEVIVNDSDKIISLKYISRIILGIYLNEKLNFYCYILVRNVQINTKNGCLKSISKLPQHSLITSFVAKAPCLVFRGLFRNLCLFYYKIRKCGILE